MGGAREARAAEGRLRAPSRRWGPPSLSPAHEGYGVGTPLGGGERSAKSGEKVMAISKELLEILACPQCKGEVTLTQDESGLVCRTCKLLYPIRDDIPIMLIDEAQRLE